MLLIEMIGRVKQTLDQWLSLRLRAGLKQLHVSLIN